MNFILITFGENKNGLWNMKRFGFKTIADAVDSAEQSITNGSDYEGYIVLASYYDDGKNADEMKVVYEQNTEAVDLQVFPYIGVRRSKFITV